MQSDERIAADAAHVINAARVGPVTIVHGSKSDSSEIEVLKEKKEIDLLEHSNDVNIMWVESSE